MVKVPKNFHQNFFTHQPNTALNQVQHMQKGTVWLQTGHTRTAFGCLICSSCQLLLTVTMFSSSSLHPDNSISLSHKTNTSHQHQTAKHSLSACPTLHRTGLARQKRSILPFLPSLARGAILHAGGLARWLVQATKLTASASVEPGSACCRKPIRPQTSAP